MPNLDLANKWRDYAQTDYEELDEMAGLAPEKAKPESKTRRAIMLLKPSAYSSLEKLAFLRRTSVNDILNVMVGEYLEKNKGLLDKYDDIIRQLDEIPNGK